VQYESNGFDALIRNYVSEKLWGFYYTRTFRDELALYADEGVPLASTGIAEHPDNAFVLDQLEHPVTGVFSKIATGAPVTREADDFVVLGHS
jgi:myosin heavy subunit